MAENKKVVTPAENSRMEKLTDAMIDYALDLIEETKKVNSNENHQLSNTE